MQVNDETFQFASQRWISSPRPSRATMLPTEPILLLHPGASCTKSSCTLGPKGKGKYVTASAKFRSECYWGVFSTFAVADLIISPT